MYLLRLPDADSTRAWLRIELALHHGEEPADGQPLRRLALAVAAYENREGDVVRFKQGV